MFAERPVAIVDIGSNSVRLVVYSGATRAPSVVFNEKVMAGLGAGFAATNRLSDEAQARALAALMRFRALLDDMGVAETRVVATAAAREAENGAAFLDEVAALGFSPELISGAEEGRLAALGLLSGIPHADGIVGDLGGGSLELAEVSAGQVGRTVSLPLGVLRLEALGKALGERVAGAVAEAGFADAARGRAFYMVGGSWRNLARLHLGTINHPLGVTHQHVMPPEAPRALAPHLDQLAALDPGRVATLSANRLQTLPHANRLLAALVEALAPDCLVASGMGIREGLLFDALDPATRALDPLIEQARDAGAGLGRFEQHGERLDAWIAPVCQDAPRAARLRLAACLLSDIAWAAHPDFRADRGVDMALHGNWMAIDAPGRVMLAQALYANLGGRDLPDPALRDLCGPEELRQARLWGVAMALGQRLSGGTAAGLARTRLSLEPGEVILTFEPDGAALAGEAVRKKLKSLAKLLRAEPRFVVA